MVLFNENLIILSLLIFNNIRVSYLLLGKATKYLLPPKTQKCKSTIEFNSRNGFSTSASCFANAAPQIRE